MDVYYECGTCQTIKRRADLRQVIRDETCLYVCRQCGSEEGTSLQLLRPATLAPKCPREDGDPPLPLCGGCWLHQA